MKRLLFLTTFIFVFGLALPTFSFAQGMPVSSSSPDNTTIQNQQQEEQEGKKLLDDLNNKTVTCSQLKDTDFEKIGEYFMGQSIGNTQRHIAMNGMMKKMMGEKGEEQAHTSMGKRMSGCDARVSTISQETGFMPMMGMMSMMMKSGWGVFGLITLILVIVFLVLGIIYFWKEIKRRK